MKIIPQGDMITGRVAEVIKASGSSLLLMSEQKKDTVLILVERVGPGVSLYKVGDLLLTLHFNHIYFRGGIEHRAIFDQKNVLAIIEDVSPEQLDIHGVPKNGASSAEARA